MRRVRRQITKGQRRAALEVQTPIPLDDGTVTTPTSLTMIQALIPLGLKAVEEALLADVAALAGPRYERHDAHPGVVRWGSQRGSIYLADQKLAITVPRARDRVAGCERPLSTYTQLQAPRAHDVGLFRRVLGGLSCREYEAAAEAVPEAFGLARSSVSRRFIRASARELQRLQERRLDDAEWLVLVLDGKTFAGDQLVIALGVTSTGEKRIPGLVQTATENKRVIAAFLRELVERGFPGDRPLLVVLDGAKGLRAAASDVFGDVPVQRCSAAQAGERGQLSRQTGPGDVAPEAAGGVCAPDLCRRPPRARAGLPRAPPGERVGSREPRRGMEETLTLHRLELFPELGVSFKTTNLIESVMSRLEAKTRRIASWRTSDPKLRWTAAALGAMERQFRRVKHHRQLPLLKRALHARLTTTSAAA